MKLPQLSVNRFFENGCNKNENTIIRSVPDDFDNIELDEDGPSYKQSDNKNISVVLKSFSSQLDENSVNVNPYIKELKILLSNLTTMQCNIVLTWIKAHIGLENNEKVDQLEKKSILSGEETLNDIVLQECISKTRLHDNWKLQWNQYCWDAENLWANEGEPETIEDDFEDDDYVPEHQSDTDNEQSDDDNEEEQTEPNNSQRNIASILGKIV
ncbi:protein PFC0760c-like [Diabrotica virgifera virgifera]|uniref:RNase H type-1 domain-containing protein n=1 Tax=Diabrotica virgifera virgifera TaxID=50390 RepID=A0ABM5JSU9_DIAVI|nr:protein PFC0760c-like [Diabrotica virgifera virgifera]